MASMILVVNAGSSSVKFRAFDADSASLDLLMFGQVEGIQSAPRFTACDGDGATIASKAWGEGDTLGHHGALEAIADFLLSRRAEHELVAVGHRVVHGGMEFDRPARVSPEVIERLAALAPLAPLHQPHNIEPMRILTGMLPDLPQVACFDTAFHRSQPELAQAYALPREITSRGVRRYGFHGLSYEYIASALPEAAPHAARGRTVVAHLGNGCSMCALNEGKSIGTTMGFTAVDGLMMGTRSGNLDPGVVLYLMNALRMDARAVEDLLYRRSGLLGVSGISGDMRLVLASDDPRARFAVDLFVYRISRELGSLAAALGGIDALVFTGGIGERSAIIRERVCRAAAWLGLELDAAANARGGPRISACGGTVSAWVIPTNEELMIARHTRELTHRRHKGGE